MAGIDDILGYWFDGAGDDDVIDAQHPCYQRWFRGGRPVDAYITQTFGADLDDARAGGRDRWRQTSRGALALVVLLDQFPRHVYRGDARAFDSDETALAVTRECIASGADEALALVERIFFYLPIQHSERIEDHDLAIERYQRLVELAKQRRANILGFCELGLKFQLEHTDTLRQFGRYPYRNAALGRASTVKETEFLAALAAPAR